MISTYVLRLPAAALAVAAAAGCASSGGSDRAGAVAAAAVDETSRGATDLDQTYLIGPTPARELGYRIHFQTRTWPEGDSGVKKFVRHADSLFVLDGRNFLTRLRAADGQRLWRIPIGKAVDEVQGITYLPEYERVFVTVGADLLILDETTGSLVDRQKLGQMASTRPVPFGPFLVYGSRSGQVVWHSFEIGHSWRAYQVSESIGVAPLLVGDLLIVLGSNGRIMALDAGSAIGVWDKRLLNAVVTEPAAGHGLLYIAGLDQYLWALDIGTSRTAWKYLAEAPLVTPPTLIGAKVYQNIPNEGLVCFEAAPVNDPDGEKLWTAPDVTGAVLGRLGHRLYVWDEASDRIAILEDDRGAVVTTVHVPGVSRMHLSRAEGGDLYAAGDDGRVIRLVPR